MERKQELRMNRRDIVLVTLILLAALAGFFLMAAGTGGGTRLEITVDGEVFGVYDLSENQTVKIGETNICRIENGTAWMEQADCPDQLCVHQKKISKAGETIVCLPNRVTLTVLGRRGSDQPDVIVS